MIVCLHKGTGLIGKLIKWQTRGQYSHASIYCGYDSLFESREFKGVRFSKLNLNEDVDYFYVSTSPMQDVEAVRFMRKVHGKDYDYRMVFRFISRLPEAPSTEGKYFCSELVFDLFKSVGIELLGRTEGWQVSPSMLAKSPKLEKVSYEEISNFGSLVFSLDGFFELQQFARQLRKGYKK